MVLQWWKKSKELTKKYYFSMICIYIFNLYFFFNFFNMIVGLVRGSAVVAMAENFPVA